MDRFPSGKRVGNAEVWRPNRWSVSVAFPESFLGQGVTAYAWNANSLFHTGGDGPCGTTDGCRPHMPGRAPNRGQIKQRL